MRWVLARAFADPDAPAPAVDDPGLTFPLAQQLNLDARIGARIPEHTFQAEVGPEVAHRFLLARFVCETRNQQLLNQIRTLADLAQRRNVPLCLLKGSALVVRGVAKGRWVSDCDILVAASDAQRLFAALIAYGWAPEAAPPPSHHLPHLTAPGGSIEVHIALPALRANPRGNWVDFETLATRSLLAPAGTHFPPVLLIPDREVLAAHAIAHTLRQHRFAPDAYPFLRLLADLADLGVQGSTLQAFFRATGFELELPQREAEAVMGLTRALTTSEGMDWDSHGNATPEGVLLAHFVAGALDPNYRQSLKFRAVLAKPTNRDPIVGHLRTLWRTIWLTDRQVELIYGVQKSRHHLWVRRLARRFDLLARSVRVFRAALRVYQKRKSPIATKPPSGISSHSGA